MNIDQRSKQLLSLDVFGQSKLTLDSFPMRLAAPDQYVLRMMIKSPETNGFVIPGELLWLERSVLACHEIQRERFVDHPYAYVTVRSGIVTSTTDDLWHVDGFSMRVPHPPEQNYIWTDTQPTEVLNQVFDIPKDFDPFKHNIHQYFQDHEAGEIITLEPEKFYAIDPYVVHRRPAVTAGIRRTFIRISFIPIEIEDDTCTQNPLLPHKSYGRTDIRQQLVRY